MGLAPELKQYYDKLDEMFATEGWKIVVKEALQEIYQLQADALEEKSWDDVLRKQGRAFQLALLARMEETADAQRKLLEEEARLAEEDESADV